MALWIGTAVPARRKTSYEVFLHSCDLRDEQDTDFTVLLTDEADTIYACGSLRGNVLKQIAVRPEATGGGACALIVTELIAEAFHRGERHLFLYTKPASKQIFAALGFYPLVETADVVMMENQRTGLASYLQAIGRQAEPAGAIVCNCNPFTLGHLHLMEYAAARCKHLLLFVLSADLSFFPTAVRYDLVKRGTAHLKNVTVLHSRDYLVSSATFPAYFLKETAPTEEIKADLDLLLFARQIAPALNITRRFVGKEPFDPVTAQYNARMKEILPQYGIEVTEIERLGAISASQVRRLLAEKDWAMLRALVPEVTYEYCRNHFAGHA